MALAVAHTKFTMLDLLDLCRNEIQNEETALALDNSYPKVFRVVIGLNPYLNL